MAKKKIDVKKHPRTLESGKVTNVKKHKREIDTVTLDKDKIKNIKTGKSIHLKNDSIIETINENPKLKLTRIHNGIELVYSDTITKLPLAKKLVKSYRKYGIKSYYFIGSIKGVTVYRIYTSNVIPDKSPKDGEFVKLSPEGWADVAKEKIAKEKKLAKKTVTIKQLKSESDNELKDLRQKMKELEDEERKITEESNELMKKYGYTKYKQFHMKHIKKKYKSVNGKQDRLRIKIDKLESLGVSSKRQKKILDDFKSQELKIINADKDITGTEYIKIGYIDDIGYVKVKGTRWSTMVTKGKGENYDITGFELITKDEHDKLISGDIIKTTSFLGAKETKIVKPEAKPKPKPKPKPKKKVKSNEVLLKEIKGDISDFDPGYADAKDITSDKDSVSIDFRNLGQWDMPYEDADYVWEEGEHEKYREKFEKWTKKQDWWDPNKMLILSGESEKTWAGFEIRLKEPAKKKSPIKKESKKEKQVNIPDHIEVKGKYKGVIKNMLYKKSSVHDDKLTAQKVAKDTRKSGFRATTRKYGNKHVVYYFNG